jgi:hypothetical protein
METSYYKCPECGNIKNFAVVLKIWGVPSFDRNGNLEGISTKSDLCPNHDAELDAYSGKKDR